MARALTLAAEGRARAAREALLLGQRFVRAAEVLAGSPAGGAATAEEEAPDPEDDPRAELERRLGNLLDHALKQRAREIGIETIEGVDVRPFRREDGTVRPATPAEKAAIAAGDWPPPQWRDG